MSVEVTGFIGLATLLVLLAIRIPVAFAMFLVGFVGICALKGWNAAMSLLSSETFTLASSSELVVVPLFILMGNVATATGMSRQLYTAAYAMIGHVRGGLASATVVGCGGFAALSGSSVASALTMGKVSLSEMERFKYDQRLSTGVVAAGGTLGILIPPLNRLRHLRNSNRAIYWPVVPRRRFSGLIAAHDVRADCVDHLLDQARAWPARSSFKWR